MNALEFIFKLLWQFITFEPGRWEELKEKAFLWRTKAEAEGKTLKEEDKKWYHKLIPHDNEWYVQLGLALFFLFAVKSVRTWLLTDATDIESDLDDEDDDDDIPISKVRKMGGFVPREARM